jgi:thioredoxin reductase
MFLGADPATGWLAGCGVETDRAGFVVTGGNCTQATAADPLRTSLPGVIWPAMKTRRCFACGDMRSIEQKTNRGDEKRSTF